MYLEQVNAKHHVPEHRIGKGLPIERLDNCSSGHVLHYAKRYHKKHNPAAYDRYLNGDPMEVKVNYSSQSLIDLVKRVTEGAGDMEAERMLLGIAADLKLPEDMIIVPLADLSRSMEGTPMLLAMLEAIILALANYRRGGKLAEAFGGVWINFDTTTRFYRIPDLLGADRVRASCALALQRNAYAHTH